MQAALHGFFIHTISSAAVLAMRWRRPRRRRLFYHTKYSFFFFWTILQGVFNSRCLCPRATQPVSSKHITIKIAQIGRDYSPTEYVCRNVYATKYYYAMIRTTVNLQRMDCCFFVDVYLIIIRHVIHSALIKRVADLVWKKQTRCGGLEYVLDWVDER